MRIHVYKLSLPGTGVEGGEEVSSLHTLPSSSVNLDNSQG